MFPPLITLACFFACIANGQPVYIALQQTNDPLIVLFVAFLGRFLPKLEPQLRAGAFFLHATMKIAPEST